MSTAQQLLADGKARLSELQAKLYANDRWALLLITKQQRKELAKARAILEGH